ncbi:MAG: FHA domain-containing protein [Prochloraceae cyanobacterium]|nr:FHA domain-containing protein [Prochloraceae cyanobacterium]
MKVLINCWQLLTGYFCRYFQRHKNKPIETEVKGSYNMGIICPECGHKNELDALYCDECGSELPKSAPASDINPEIENTAAENSDVLDSVERSNASLESDREFETVDVIPEDRSPASESEEGAESNASEQKEEFVSLPLSALENKEPSVPLSTATRLEFDEEETPQPSPTVLQLSQATLVDTKSETRFELPTAKNTIYIGRPNEELPVQVDLSDLEDADIISRVHAAIHVEDDRFFLEDAGSANGTWLNGEQLKPGIRFRKLLKSGDEIAFGKKQSIKLTFEQD